MLFRYFIYFAYNGSNYCGWQSQPNGIAVQEVLEKALSTILRSDISLTGAGRTDAGVHAKRMAAHFDSSIKIENSNKLAANLNSLLPNDIAVSNIEPVAADAHARFDAISRKYEYHIVQQKSPFLNGLACKFTHPLNIDLMNEAANALFDYIDFTSFSKLHTDVKTNNCTIMQAFWEKQGEELVFTIEANRFLRNMVRAIVGTLLDVGREKITIAQFREIIEKKDRCSAGHSVPACGLYFIEARY